MVLILILGLLIGAICIFLVFFVLSFLSAGPLVVSPKKNINALLEKLDCQKGEKLIDLGSGEGRVVFAAAEKGLDATGVEFNILLYLFSKVRSCFSRHKGRIHFKLGNLWKISLAPYDVVTCFVFPEVRVKIKKKFEKEAQKGARLAFLKHGNGFEIIRKP